VNDTTGEPIVPKPQKARAARRRRKKRRGTPRPNLDAINARRREEAAARRGLLTASSKNPAHPTIEEFVTGHQYLGLRPTPYQLTLQKAMYGLALTDQELDIWRESTGGREYPGTPFPELTCIAGARSGKNSYIATPILLYEALYGGSHQTGGKSVL
jgi:hypothetical protein